MERFNDACAKNPDIERPKIMLLRHTYVGSSEDDVARAAHELSTYYNYFFAWFKNEKPVTQWSDRTDPGRTDQSKRDAVGSGHAHQQCRWRR